MKAKITRYFNATLGAGLVGSFISHITARVVKSLFIKLTIELQLY